MGRLGVGTMTPAQEYRLDVCARCKKVADHTNGTDDHPELCDACWSAEFADTQEDMAS